MKNNTAKIEKEGYYYTVYYKRPEVGWILHESFDVEKNAIKFKKFIIKDMKEYNKLKK